ncbi:PspC domain-containing protein [Telluribacter sp.]|jgi:phage shock protein PspC (stress-responsive transcriptional regulator)|uniref:PspC domain-containing protein n=1 Tax=Telluribacter sp. TaxID=1978767 RepID=UPI002E15030B|nr:PspC domain-containing protein [Telluribacter sp.]
MKKTISINISGIIFYIEEDGYDKLRNYLNSVQRYFSSFADSKEILSDIEGRIAERFLNKQKIESKQVISLADVDELIAAMGTVADFEAIEQAEDLLSEPLQAASGDAYSSYQQTHTSYEAPRTETHTATATAPRKLFRDLRRKLLGGVAAGLAHYFTVDPLWVRLAFLMAVIGLPVGAGALNLEEVFGPLAGITVILYIAMWVAFPGSATLEEDTQIKKFYRDPDRKVVGGVAAGVASYFGVDLGVVRFLWVLAIFLFGFGFLLYIILWVISPVAKTLTEKMEMQGEPITLSNIESNIKRGLNLNETTGQESTLTKLLLFPFRAIAILISGLGKILKGIGPIFRIVIGALLVAMAVLALIGLLIGGTVGLGMRDMLPFGDIPPMMILRELPGAMILSMILLTTIPFIVILLLGLTLVANRRVASGTVWLTLAGLWVVGIIGTAITGGVYQTNFSRRGEVTQTEYFRMPNSLLTLDQQENDEDDDFNWSAGIILNGYEGLDSLRLEKEIRARGRNTDDARKNASDLRYNVALRDSVLLFDEQPVLAENSRFRGQEITATLFIPYDRPFAMTRAFYYDRLSSRSFQGRRYEIEYHDNNEQDWRNLRWVMRRDSGLVCINMPAGWLAENSGDNDEYTYDSDDDDNSVNLGQRGKFIKQFEARDFEGVDLGGAYAVDIRQGQEFRVQADGDEEDIDNLQVTVRNGILHVERPAEFRLFNGRSHRIGLVITMPTLRTLELAGANKTRVSGFTGGTATMSVDVSGASSTELNVDVSKLDIEITGASKVLLKGSTGTLTADLSGACKLDATGMQINTAEVDASGASNAQLGRINNLRKNSSGASKIEAYE